MMDNMSDQKDRQSTLVSPNDHQMLDNHTLCILRQELEC